MQREEEAASRCGTHATPCHAMPCRRASPSRPCIGGLAKKVANEPQRHPGRMTIFDDWWWGSGSRRGCAWIKWGLPWPSGDGRGPFWEQKGMSLMASGCGSASLPLVTCHHIPVLVAHQAKPAPRSARSIGAWRANINVLRC